MAVPSYLQKKQERDFSKSRLFRTRISSKYDDIKEKVISKFHNPRNQSSSGIQQTTWDFLSKYEFPLLEEQKKIKDISDNNISLKLNTEKNLALNARKGLNAQSIVKVLERKASTDLVEVRIVTGRPHQIRIHMSILGSPLVGDRLYKSQGDICQSISPGEGGYSLHAHRFLNINLGSHTYSFEANLPSNLLMKSES